MLHLRQAFRSLQKNKLFSIFNIFGFAVGFTVCIIIALYVYRESNVNAFFPDAKRTFRLKDADKNNAHFDVAILPILKDRFPEIEKIAPMVYLADEDFNITIKVGDKFMVASEIMSTNNDFFDLTGIDKMCIRDSHYHGDPLATRCRLRASNHQPIRRHGGQSVRSALGKLKVEFS